MFKSTFVFCSLKTWSSDLLSLAIQNKGTTTLMSTMATGGVVVPAFLFEQNWFGTTYFVLILVMGTVFVNAVSGVTKNAQKAGVFLALSQKYAPATKEYRINIRRWKNHKFDIKKLYFVFFKCLAFLSYLLVVKSLTSDNPDGGEWQIIALNIGAEILIKVPIFLFWYYEFKSIGENSEYIFGQKASIFRIVEGFVEPRIFKFYGNKTPSDGGPDDFNPPTPKP